MDHSSEILKATEDNITRVRAALLLRSLGHPKRASLLHILSSSLRDRFQQTGHVEDLNEAIRVNREALLLRPAGHPERASSLKKLSLSLRDGFQQTGQLEELNESIQLDREALLLYPVGHPKRASALTRLSAGLGKCFQQTGQIKDLDEVIELNREALLVCPTGNPRCASLNNLSLGLRDRFKQTGRLEDLNESIQLNREALLLRPVGHPDRATSLKNLGVCLRNHFQQTGHLKDLDESIHLDQEVLLLRPVGHPQHPSSLTNLSASLVNRFRQTGQIKDLDESIQLNQEALLLFPAGHPERASSLNNLSQCLRDRFRQTGHLKDLDKSISLNRQALRLYPVGHPGRASSLNNLSGGFWNRLQQTSHPRDLKKCVSAARQAAEDRYSPVSDCLFAVSRWVYFTQLQPDLGQSNLDAYITGLSLISRSLTMMPKIHVQYQHLLSVIKLPEFVSDGASQAIQLGQLALAVEIIEQGRGLLWSELRGLRTPMDKLKAVDSSLADELMRVNHRLEILSMENSVQTGTDFDLEGDSSHYQREISNDPFGHSLSEKRHLLKAQGDIIEKIQKIPGFENFLGRKSFSELKSAAKHGPVIVVNCSRYRSDVIIILEQKSPVLIPMGEGFYEEAQALVQQLVEARPDVKAAPKRYNHVLRATLQDLWDLVVSAVVTKLQELHIPKMSQIFWCPTSILSTLPLHAAGPIAPGTKKFLPDLYISSYTPTLTALISDFTTTKSSSQLPRLLVACQHGNSLRNTKEEINQVVQYKKHIPTTSVEGPAATKEALEKALVDHGWFHIASHGTLVPTEPFSSYFSLAGGSRFTLLDIIRLNLPNATFAFLSACHTAEQSPGSVHNEVIHLAAAMQFCGFRSVVGTMWEMADVDGPEIVKDFYSCLFSAENLSRCNDVGAQARALSEAIRKMRGKKGVTLERWVNFVHIGA